MHPWVRPFLSLRATLSAFTHRHAPSALRQIKACGSGMECQAFITLYPCSATYNRTVCSTPHAKPTAHDGSRLGVGKRLCRCTVWCVCAEGAEAKGDAGEPAYRYQPASRHCRRRTGQLRGSFLHRLWSDTVSLRIPRSNLSAVGSRSLSVSVGSFCLEQTPLSVSNTHPDHV